MLDPAHSTPPSESQIITTLNSSIDQLLSRISQVQLDYQESNRLHPLSSIPTPNHHNALQECKIKRRSSKCSTLASLSTKHISSQDEPNSQ
jgi:hypothetical protein